MTNEFFSEILYGIESNSMSIDDVYQTCLQQNIKYNQAVQFLYSINRSKRFELFIALYNASLRDNPNECFKTFKEAYCSSDNIYAQIQYSSFYFDINDFLFSLEKQGVNFLSFMNEDEKNYYNHLPQFFTIYRGMSDMEYKSKNYGISWTLSRKIAENYIYFDKNNVQIGNGGLANLRVSKKDIITIFSVHGEKEIIYIM